MFSPTKLLAACVFKEVILFLINAPSSYSEEFSFSVFANNCFKSINLVKCMLRQSMFWIASDSSFLIFSGETSLYAIFNGV